MKTNKLFRLFMAICISFSLIGATSIQAQENNIKISEDGFAIVYADLNNELEVKMEAQKAFDAGATVVKVENNAVKPRSSGWNSNSATYYFGDVLHGSKGTIRCYVVAGTGVDHVTNCSFSVEVWRTGFSLLERYIVNNNTMNVAGKWKCLQSGFFNVVTPQYSVSLF